MKIKVNAKNLQDALTLAGNVTGKPEFSNIKADKKGVWIISTGNDTSVKVKVEDAEVIKDGEITVTVNVVSGLVRGRGDIFLEGSAKSSNVTFSSAKGSKYSGSFVVPPLTKISVTYAEGKKEIKFSKDVQILLEDAIKSIGISNVYTDSPMYVWVHCEGTGGTTIFCADEFHVAHYHHPEVNIGKKQFSLPLSTFQTIQSLTKGKAYSISIQDSQIFAKNAEMELAAPLTQSESKQSVSDIQGYIKSLNKADGWFSINRETLLTILNNAEAIYDSNVPLKLKGDGKNMNFTMETSYGKLKESVKTECEWGKFETSVDPFLLRDMLASVTETEVKVQVCDKQSRNLFIKIGLKPVKLSYVCCVL